MLGNVFLDILTIISGPNGGLIPILATEIVNLSFEKMSDNFFFFEPKSHFRAFFRKRNVSMPTTSRKFHVDISSVNKSTYNVWSISVIHGLNHFHLSHTIDSPYEIMLQWCIALSLDILENLNILDHWQLSFSM